MAKRPSFRTLLLCVAVALLTAPARAETVKFVVPFAAGGPVDQWARIVTADLGARLNANVIVEDRDGAGGAIAGEYVARSAPDGNTVLFGSLGSCVLSPLLKPPEAYDPIKSFEPVMRVGAVPMLLVVNTELGVATLSEMLALTKQRPLSYGSAGVGTTMNIAGEMLNYAANVKIAHVPYRGAAPAISDLLGDHIDVLYADLPILMPLVTAHRIKAIALLASDRTPLLPDLPTTKELGLPGVVLENWYGAFVPAGTAAAARDRLEQALLTVVATATVRQRFAENGMHDPLGHDAFAASLKQEFAEWPERIKALGITGE